jgi:copper chaperone CopZ
MHSRVTAIIHLRDPALPRAEAVVAPMLRVIRGIDEVSFEPDDSLITVEYDGEQTSLAEIVRVIEDCGPVVTSVAQRRVQMRKAS